MTSSDVHGRPAIGASGLLLAGVALVGAIAVTHLSPLASFALAFGILGLGLVAWQPQPAARALLVLALVIPHGMSGNESLRLELGPVPVHPQDLLLAGLLVVAVFAWLKDRRHPRDTPGLMASPILWALLGVAVVQGIGVAVGLLQDNTIWDVVRDLRSFAYYLALPAWMIILRRQENQGPMLRALLFGATLFSALCLLLVLSPSDFWLRQETVAYWKGTERFYFHNHYVLAASTPVAFYLAVTHARRRARAFYGVATALMLGAIAVSLTRNLMASTMGAVALTGLLLFRRELRRHITLRPATVLSLCLVGGLFYATGGPVIARTSQSPRVAARAAPTLQNMESRLEALAAPHKLDSSFRGRLVTYQGALEDFLDSPVFGRGLGAMAEVPWALANRRSVHAEGYQPSVDNILLTVAFKSGLLGLALVGLFTAVLLRRQWRVVLDPARSPLPPVAAAGLFAGTLGLVISSMLHTVLLNSRFVLVFCVVVALMERAAMARPRPGR